MPKAFLLTNKRYKLYKHIKDTFREHQQNGKEFVIDFSCFDEPSSSPPPAMSPPASLSSVSAAASPAGSSHEDSDSSCSYTSENRPVTPSMMDYSLECRDRLTFLYDLMTQSPNKASSRDGVEQDGPYNASYPQDLSRITQIFAPLNDIINRSAVPTIAGTLPAPVLPTEEPGGGGMTDTHVCVDCGKRYSTSSNLARHRQTHRNSSDKKARKCPHCDKVYVSMPAYSMHVRTHNQGCECQFCGKRFSRPWLLQGHIRTHTGEKPFTCSQCGKAFADKSNLRAHIQTHSSEKPFICGRCGKAFALKSYLYKHEESSCMRGQRFKHFTTSGHMSS